MSLRTTIVARIPATVRLVDRKTRKAYTTYADAPWLRFVGDGRLRVLTPGARRPVVLTTFTWEYLSPWSTCPHWLDDAQRVTHPTVAEWDARYAAAYRVVGADEREADDAGGGEGEPAFLRGLPAPRGERAGE